MIGEDNLVMVSEPDGHIDIIPLLDTLELQLTHLIASLCYIIMLLKNRKG